MRRADLAKKTKKLSSRKREREREHALSPFLAPRATSFPSFFRSSVAAIFEISMSRVERGRERVGWWSERETGHARDDRELFSRFRFLFLCFFFQPRRERKKRKRGKMQDTRRAAAAAPVPISIPTPLLRIETTKMPPLTKGRGSAFRAIRPAAGWKKDGRRERATGGRGASSPIAATGLGKSFFSAFLFGIFFFSSLLSHLPPRQQQQQQQPLAASFGPTRTPAIPIPATMEEARRASAAAASCNNASFSSPTATSAPVPIPLSPSLFGSHAAGSAPAPAAIAASGAGAAFGSPFKGAVRAGGGVGGGISPAAAPSTPRPVPVSASSAVAAASAASDPHATSPGKRSPPSRRRGGKIDGLDYYEYVELIRASSL